MSKFDAPKIPVGSLFVEGTKMSRLIAMVGNSAILRPVGADANDMQDFMMTGEEIIANQKQVSFEIKFPSASYMREATALHTGGVQFVDLADEAQQKVLFSICCCIVLENLRAADKIKITEPSLDEHHALIEQRVHELYRNVSGEKKRGNMRHLGFEVPGGRTLLDQYNTYHQEFFNPTDLAPKHSNAGRPRKEIPQWVMDEMEAALRPHLDGREPHLIRCYEMLQGKLLEMNAELARTQPGFGEIKVSDRKFREFAASFKSTAIAVTRKGWDEMVRSMRSGLGETKALFIGEVVDIDECEMPLWVFLEKSGLYKVFGDQTMRQLKKEAAQNGVGKIWILVAVDRATGAPLAFHLAKSPNADDTLELLRRLVSDKTALAREAGCEHAPSEPVRPNLIVMDTGSGLWNNVVPRAILALGGSFRFSRTKTPTDKPFVERHFATLGSDIMKALHGYNGQGPGKMTGYNGQEMTVMTMAQLEKYLWWYFTDCLPFKTTQRKGGWGAINHVMFARFKKMYGTAAALSHREVRRAIGLRVTRKVTKMGIEAYRMPYQGDGKFRQWVLANLGATVTICVAPNRIEEVTAITADGQVFYLTACLSQFKHFTLSEWCHFLQEWRHSDPATQEVSVETLYRFYNRIRQEMNGLLDFYGKEHKVIRLDDAQALADTLAGQETVILHGDASSPSAALSALYASDANGIGVYTPGDEIVEEVQDGEPSAALPTVESHRTGAKPSKSPKKFTGAPEGKGKLK
jgi:hypothetical protein